MERLRHDDPTRIGPYVTLARLDADSDAAHCVPERRYLARAADGERTVLLCVPRVGADPSRWAIEAEGARRLSVPGFLTVAEVGGTAGFPWYAAAYAPALPLPAVLAAYGGPLPEDTVRRLGAALAQALAAAHAQGVTHAGLSPAAVLVTPSGPLLACFGATRAERTGHDPGCLAPERAAGAPAAPAGDVYSLGAVLAYAATGHTVPEQSELPLSLRRLTGACLARDPADRPGTAQDVLRELAAPVERPGPARDPRLPTGVHAPAPSPLPTGTVLDPATPLSLPGRVVAALAAQSGALLAAELPAPYQSFATTPQKAH
ncbi:serine/threonine protein kinase [Streptomyces sp. NPDC096339]|uniref:serine/threonine protein kinase n=1 Tax=Streptomyces sp. NPDC096339 TaxID=3366086 RepID=UPI003826DAA2